MQNSWWKEHFTLVGKTKVYSEGSVEAIIERLIEDAVAKTAVMGTEAARKTLITKWLGRETV